MRHRIATLLYRIVDWLDHTHCPYCGTEDLVCCIGIYAQQYPGCRVCRERAGNRCPDCDGTGSEIEDVGMREADPLVVTICPRCEGTGAV